MSHIFPLRSRIIGRLDCKSESLLHIGSGGVEARREILSVTAHGKMRILIPASSLKGVFRRRAELIFRSIGTQVLANLFYLKDEGVEVREKKEEEAVLWLLNQPNIYETLVSLGFGDDLDWLEVKNAEDLKRRWEERGADQNVRKKFKSMVEKYASTLHPICRLFGTQSVAAKVRFLDVLLDSRLVEKPGIAIDRKTLKVREHNLYFLESIPPLSFAVWFIADNLLPGEEESLLFACTLNSILQMPLELGARKSVGMGSIGLEGGNFWLVETEKDKSCTVLANPFKHSKPMGLREFINWLTAC